jgi:hypothetical protein
MDADGAVGFTAAAEQAAQREIQFDGFGVDLGGFEKGLDGLVRLLVEEKIQAAKIGARQGARFAQQVLEINPRGDPAKDEKDG